jgi:spore coat protein CotH
MLRTLLLSVLAFSCFSGLSAQGSGNNIFDDSVLHEINMTFEEVDYWDILNENFGNGFDPSEGVDYLMASVTIDGETVDSIGIRFKGFTSASAATKKPFKFDFNEFVSGKRYDGLRKLNLNNGTGDPGLQRDVICYDLMNRSGVNAPRVSFARVSINGEFFAIYQVVEQVDKEFLKRSFSNAKGNLFKNKGWYNFEYNGTNPDSYRVLELKTNEEGDDYSGLIGLVDVLNNTPDELFAGEIEQIFDVDRYLKTLAIDVATDNWDSNLEHGRNWYMYEDTTTGVFHWVPWDYNFALNSGFFGGGNDDCFSSPEVVAVLNGTTSIQFYENGFHQGSNIERSWDFGDGSTAAGRETTHVFGVAGTYEVCVTVTVDGECTEQDCRSITTTENLADCPAVTNGEFPGTPDIAFAVLVNFDSGCCGEFSTDCAETHSAIRDFIESGVDGNDGGGGGGFGRDFQVDQRTNGRLLINKLLAVPEFYERYLNHFCDLMERIFRDEYYFELVATNRTLLSAAIENSPNELYPFNEFEREMGADGISTLLANRIENLQQQLVELNACSDDPVASIPIDDVVINEFVADNDSTSTISDPDGGFPDWIELYNNTDADIDLSGVFLSDKPDNLDKWEFPDGTTITANGYLIIWADEDGNQDGLHANFKLGKNGEAIYLSNAGDSTRIDEVVFGPQETNVSMSRVPNGTGDFMAQHTTHGYSNNTAVANRNVAGEIDLLVYPNPADDFLNVRFPGAAAGAMQVDVYAVTGRKVFSNPEVNTSALELDLSSLTPGFYFLRVRDAEGKLGTVKFAKR